MPREQAYDVLLFAQRNPKPCPVLDVTEPGEVSCSLDLRHADDAVRAGALRALLDLARQEAAAWAADGKSFLYDTELTRGTKSAPIRQVSCQE